MFVVLEHPGHARQVVSGADLLETDRRERAGAKNQLHYLLRSTRATELSTAVLESIAQIDGSVEMQQLFLSREPLDGTKVPPADDWRNQRTRSVRSAPGRCMSRNTMNPRSRRSLSNWQPPRQIATCPAPWLLPCPSTVEHLRSSAGLALVGKGQQAEGNSTCTMA